MNKSVFALYSEFLSPAQRFFFSWEFFLTQIEGRRTEDVVHYTEVHKAL